MGIWNTNKQQCIEGRCWSICERIIGSTNLSKEVGDAINFLHIILKVTKIDTTIKQIIYYSLLSKSTMSKICTLYQTLVSVKGDQSSKTRREIIELVHDCSGSETIIKSMLGLCIPDLFHNLHFMRSSSILLVLKSLRNLMQLDTVTKKLENTKLLQTLFMILSNRERSHIQEIQVQVVNILYTYTRLSKVRLEQVCTTGLVPTLQQVSISKTTIREMSIQILCDIVYVNENCRQNMMHCDGVRMFLALLQNKNTTTGIGMNVPILDALIEWSRHDKQVSNILSESRSIAFLQTWMFGLDGKTFESVVGSLHNLLSISMVLEERLSSTWLVSKLMHVYTSENTALNRVKIVKTLCLIWRHIESRLKNGDKMSIKAHLSNDKSILVREIGKRLEQDHMKQYTKADRISRIREDIKHFVMTE